MDETLKRRVKRGTYELNPNFEEGFKTSVKNGQSMLALEYLVEYLTDLQAKVLKLELEVELLKKPKAQLTKSKATAEQNEE